MRIVRHFWLLAAMAGSAAQATTPLPPCQVIEDGMEVGRLTSVGTEGSGVVVELYFNQVLLHGTTFVPHPGPVTALDYFSGVRATHCASGTIVAIPDVFEPEQVAVALGATEFLRAAVQARKPVRLESLKSAVKAVYGKAIVLQENEETCGCNWSFPELRPKGMTPYPQRGSAQN